MTGQERIEQLRKSHPHIAIKITFTPDPSFVWDGDGPDPAEENAKAYDVGVVVTRIERGRIIKGYASLGGYYAVPEEIRSEKGGNYRDTCPK